jgi:hypothetical protein
VIIKQDDLEYLGSGIARLNEDHVRQYLEGNTILEVSSLLTLLVPPGPSTGILKHLGTLHFQGRVGRLTKFSADQFEAANMTSSGETEVTGKLHAGGLIDLHNVRSDSIRALQIWIRNCCRLGSRGKVHADALMIELLVEGGKEAVVQAKQGIYVKTVADFHGRLKAPTRAKIGVRYNNVNLHHSKVRVRVTVRGMSVDPRAMTPELERSIERFMETEGSRSRVKGPDDVYLDLAADVREFPSREEERLASYIKGKRLGHAGTDSHMGWREGRRDGLPRASASPETPEGFQKRFPRRGP